MIRRLLGLAPIDHGQIAAGVPRSPQWAKVRAAHLRAHPTCAACGQREKLEVHHVVPFGVDPSRELDRSNLLTLCSDPCHIVHGHLMSWKRWNAAVVTDVAIYRTKLEASKRA